MEFLIKSGADVNAKNKDGMTPLHQVMFWKLNIFYGAGGGEKMEAIKLLISGGANINARNNEGKTPLDMAKEQGETEIVKFLTKKGAKSGK